jgi:glutathione peroxidase
LFSGKELSFADFKGKVLLIVNTASKCGFTYQYEALERLYLKNKDRGLVILGFPSDDFLHQEPGTNEEIASFCKQNYGVTFPMFAKSHVKGKQQNKLYEFLTSQKGFTMPVLWNFEKFLISAEGNIVDRYLSNVKPENVKVTNAIEEQLALITK